MCNGYVSWPGHILHSKMLNISGVSFRPLLRWWVTRVCQKSRPRAMSYEQRFSGFPGRERQGIYMRDEADTFPLFLQAGPSTLIAADVCKCGVCYKLHNWPRSTLECFRCVAKWFFLGMTALSMGPSPSTLHSLDLVWINMTKLTGSYKRKKPVERPWRDHHFPPLLGGILWPVAKSCTSCCCGNMKHWKLVEWYEIRMEFCPKRLVMWISSPPITTISSQEPCFPKRQGVDAKKPLFQQRACGPLGIQPKISG